MKKTGETKRKKIIIYYVIAIVFPSIILGILAYRGVKNDQALVEKEQRRTFQESGQKINDDLDDYLKVIENSFVEILDPARVPEKIIFSDSALTSLITIFPVVEGVFNRFEEIFERLEITDRFEGIKEKIPIIKDR